MSVTRPIPVWIDTDTAIGVPGSDVDDGLALIQAFHSPELRVRGVSAVFGNAPLAQTFPLARDVTERFGPGGVVVARGAASADELGRDSDAVRALAAALEQAPLTILAIGPLTNVGSLLRLRADLAPRIERLVMVAARRPGQRFLSVESQPTPFPDLNFECDPGAMHQVLDSNVDLVFAPWEVSSHVWLTAEDLDRLDGASESGSYIAQHSRAWLEIWQKSMGAPGFNPFDSLAVAWLTHPELIETLDVRVWIEDGPSDTPSASEAQTETKPYLLVTPERQGRRALYCHRPDPAIKAILLSRLAAPHAPA